LYPVRRSVRCAAISCAWALAALLSAAPAFAQEELLQELKTISSVRLEGYRQLSEKALRRVMKTRRPSIWPWRETQVLRFDYLRADILALQQLYRRYGFLDAEIAYQVASVRNRDQVSVAFAIREGERSDVRAVRFTGMTAFSEKDVARKLWARRGRPFDPAYVQLDTLRVSELYQEKGYLPQVAGGFARDPGDSLKITVSYDIVEGDRYRVGDVAIGGQDRVKERLVAREIVLPRGSFYQRSRVERSQERLYQSGLFRQVQIELLPDSTRTLMHFDFRVRERRPRWVDAGIGSGTEERFRLVGEWGHRNLLGQGLQGALSSRLTFYADGKFQRWRAETSLLEPWFLRSRTRAQITPYYERYDDRADPTWVVHQEFAGVHFQLRRELTRFTRVSLTQENLFANQKFEPANPEVPLPDSIIVILERDVVPNYTTHRLVLGFERDLRDNPFSPTRGSTTAISVQVAGGPFKGTSSFRKGQMSASWYTPLPNGWTLATRALAGIIDPYGPRPEFSPSAVVDSEVARVPLEDRFRIGGVNSIRSYDENSIPASGGLAVLKGGVELRIPTSARVPFLGTLGFEAYADAGNVWARPQYVRWRHFSQVDDADPNTVRYVAGLGPRIDLPVGPLRLDVTWRWHPTPSHPIFQFAIGPSF